MERQTLVTPVSSTPAHIARSFGRGSLSPWLIMALTIDTNGSSLPATAVEMKSADDDQPKDTVVTFDIQVPSDAYGMSFAAGSLDESNALAIVAKVPAALLDNRVKLKDASDVTAALFEVDGSVKGAPSGYRTSIIPASPVNDKGETLVLKRGEEITEIALPFGPAPEIGIARISAGQQKKQSTPAAYLVASTDDTRIYAADEQDVISGGGASWQQVAQFGANVSSVARENSDGTAIVQLADNSFRAIDRKADGYQNKSVESNDVVAQLVADGYRYAGLTSAWGNGSSHGLFAKKAAAGSSTAIKFVSAALLPEAFLGEADRAASPIASA